MVAAVVGRGILLKSKRKLAWDVQFLRFSEDTEFTTVGMGIGVDRAVMLLTGNDTIREVILFPTMKPLD